MSFIFDTHAHYDDDMFDEDREELLASLPSKGVCAVINCGTDETSSLKSLEYSKKYNFIWSAAGIHPHYAKDVSSGFIARLEKMLTDKKAVAIGEIGLDYHYDFSPKSAQIQVFENQLALAEKLSIPVIIHDREAHEDTLNILKKYKVKGVVHCFSGSIEMARELIKLGFYIGVGGAVTFKNAKKLPDVVSDIAIDSILLETDCPYMTPVPFRGKRCDSSYINITAQKIAELKNISVSTVFDTCIDNACKLFSIDKKELKLL